MFSRKSLRVIFGFFGFGLIASFLLYLLVSVSEDTWFQYFVSTDLLALTLVPVSILGWLVMGLNPPENLNLIIHFTNGIFWMLVGVSIVLSHRVRGFKKWIIPVSFYILLNASFNFIFVCVSEGC